MKMSSGMTTFTVRAGIQNTLTLANSQVVFIGRNKLLKCLKFNEKLEEKLSSRVDEKMFDEAINLLEQNSSIPLYFNYAKIISVVNEVSRHNSPSNSISIYRELKGLTAESNSKNLCIVLYTEFAHVLGSFAAIARCFPFYTRKTTPDILAKRFANVDVEIVVTDEKTLNDADVAYLQRIRDSVSMVGRWVDMPCNELNSEAFAREAIEFIETINAASIKQTLIKGEDLLQHGFGGIYHVGKAALSPPIFLCFSHTPHSATKTYALVGKGIVYDTGGMQIKTKTAMPNMKCDMSGAAAVVGTFYNLVSSGFTQNLHCILCIAENNISPTANKPDDIITLLSGKTVEINNTDAEGRLVLADGVFYAKEKLHADTIIDIATLTGAQHYASGKLHSSILTNDEQLERECVAAGRQCGELCHPMPFAPDLHFVDLKSALADMKNAKLEVGAMNGLPSAIAALFIGAQINFGAVNAAHSKIGDDNVTRWLHVDMASLALDDGRATGYGSTLLSTLLAAGNIDANITFKSYGLSDDLEKKYGLIGLRKDEEEENEDEEYSYEYVTEDEADDDDQIPMKEFTKDDLKVNKPIDEKKVGKWAELPKDDEDIEKAKGKSDSKVEKTSKGISEKEKPVNKDDMSLNEERAGNTGDAKLLDTTEKEVNKSSNANTSPKTLEISKEQPKKKNPDVSQNLAKTRRQESQSPALRQRLNDDKIGKPDNKTSPTSAKIPPSKIEKRKQVKTVSSNDGIIKEKSEEHLPSLSGSKPQPAAESAQFSSSTLSSKPVAFSMDSASPMIMMPTVPAVTKPPLRLSRDTIPRSRAPPAAKAIWEVRTSQSIPASKTPHVNTAMMRDPWLRATSRAAEAAAQERENVQRVASSALRHGSVPPARFGFVVVKTEGQESAIGRPASVMSEATTSYSVAPAKGTSISAREKILQQMQSFAHIAPKPVFAVAAIKPKPKPPPPPPPPPPPEEEKKIHKSASKNVVPKKPVFGIDEPPTKPVSSLQKTVTQKRVSQPIPEKKVVNKPKNLKEKKQDKKMSALISPTKKDVKKTALPKRDEMKKDDAKKKIKNENDEENKENKGDNESGKEKKSRDKEKDCSAAKEGKNEQKTSDKIEEETKEKEAAEDEEELDEDEDWEYERTKETEAEKSRETTTKKDSKDKAKEVNVNDQIPDEKEEKYTDQADEDQVDDTISEVEDEEEAEGNFGKRKRRYKKIIKRVIKKKHEPKKENTEVKTIQKRKRLCVQLIRLPTEMYEMPPMEKHLYEILKEENIAPTKRYAKKGNKEVTIPFIIPWEQTADLAGQGGMGAFGTQRDPKINIEDGHVKLIQGELKSETMLPLFEENTKKFSSQKGLTSFGAHRRNVDNVVDHHIYESASKLNLCESVIPRINQGLLTDQSNMVPFGSYRPQSTKVLYTKSMKDGFDTESNTFLSRQFQPNSQQTAGSHVIDCRRPIVQGVAGMGEMKMNKLSDGIVPKIFSTESIHTKDGSEFGSFRPLIHKSSGGYNMDYKEEMLCKLIIPYQVFQD